MTRYSHVHDRVRKMQRLYYAAALAWQAGDTDLAIPIRSAAAAIYGLLAADLTHAAGVAEGDDAGRQSATADLATLVAAVRERAQLQAVDYACAQVPSDTAAWNLARERREDLRAKLADASAAEALARRRVLEALTIT